MGTVARVVEISATSETSFEDAISTGIQRATRTLRNIKSVWIKEQHVDVTNDRLTNYRVHMLVTFVLDD